MSSLSLLVLLAVAPAPQEPDQGRELDLASHDPRVALERLTPREGFGVGLFAAERDFPIANPVSMTFDARGRLWVLTMPTYPQYLPGVPPHDKLVILEDTDGDGRADRHTVFADGLHVPTGFELGHGGAYIAQQPNLIFARDLDGDDVADTRDVVLQGFGSEDSHHSISAFTWGPGGDLYFQEGTFLHTQVETPWGPVRCVDGGTFRFEPRRQFLEVFVTYPYLNPWGHTFDRWGQDFLADASDGSNYFAAPLAGWLPYPMKHPRTDSITTRVRPTADCEIVSSPHFPDEAQGDFLITNVIGFHGIMQHRLIEEGSGFRGEQVGSLVQSSDPNFRPVDLQFGPDGALYVADWFNPLIGHMQYSLRDPRRDTRHGRIWRISASDRPLAVDPPIAGAPIPDLLDLLRSPTARVRYRVRRELGARPAREVTACNTAWRNGLDPRDPQHEHHLLEALWVQETIGIPDPDLLARVLDSSEPRARAAATRVVRHWRDSLEDPLALLAERAADPHPRVRLEALVALSAFPTERAAAIALEVRSQPMDPFLEYALNETVRALEPHWRAALRSGIPFAASNDAGLEYVLHELDTEDLLHVAPGPAVQRELLARHDVDGEVRRAALAGLASHNGTDELTELVRAIERADRGPDAHAEHLLSGLFRLLLAREPEALAPALEPLASIASTSARPLTRQFVTAVRMTADGSGDHAWAEAVGSPAALRELLDAAPLAVDEELRASLHPRIEALARALPDELASALPSHGATLGRYVRIELPGDERTLTIAELEVFRDGVNVAPGGSATQSTLNWDGVPERAIDGNTSGRWTDGGQTHTLESRPDPWWELDLGEDEPIDSLVLWNRTDPPYGRRMDGYLVRVLDGQRREVFRAEGAEAPAIDRTFELGDAGLALRRQALVALARLRVEEERTIATLRELFDDPQLARTAVRTLAEVALELWPQSEVETLAARISDWIDALPPDASTTDADGEYRALRGLGDQLAGRLSGQRRAQLRRTLATLGPVVIQLRPIRDSLLFDRREIWVEAGRAVELLFENTDIMPHNLVVTTPGKLAEVGMAAEALASEADGWARGFVPDSPAVLHATGLVQPGQSATLSFMAPSDPGEHPYVCTFPGHWIRMNGVMHVVRELPGAPEGPDTAVTQVTPSARFVKSWQLADLAPALRRSSAAGAASRGARVFEDASCVRCHSVTGEGGKTGPDLGDVTTHYSGEEILTHVLEPSLLVADEYRAEIFITEAGTIVSGLVVAEDAETVLVQEDPYRSREPVELALDEIEERVTSSVSLMPSGLLSTFSEEQILDLLAFLGARAAAQSED